MAFHESVSPVPAIQAILRGYPYSASILRELLQNSDDAKATMQVFILDKGESPALVAYNDAQFRDDDWKAIQSIHESSKKADTSKIGKYGEGFRACYHITDKPQILSGGSFAVLDPLHSEGMKIDYDEFKNTPYRKHYDFLLCTPEFPFSPGTVIRLPLRSSPSDLSHRTVHVDELHQMIKEYIAEEANISLLFLDNLKKIDIWEKDGALMTRLAIWTKSEKIGIRQSDDLSFATYDSSLSNGTAQFSWRIVQTQCSEDDAKSRLEGEGVENIFQKHKLRSDVRLAYPLSSDGYTSGRLFTFLPLPSKTNFPVHIHAPFALASSRQGLRNPNETGIISGSDDDILIKWNKLLFNHYVPRAWCYLLTSLAEGEFCKNIYSAWPPYLSSITSGDGLYWQNILPNTFNVAVQSGSAIWPRVSARDTTTFVVLGSSLVISEGEVDFNVLNALDVLDLSIVQLPKDHMQLLDSSITMLTPGNIRAKPEHRGEGFLQRFKNLSTVQKDILCKYFLSERNFGHIFGLPLLPTLNGSYISLNDRRTCVRRYTALTDDEVEVFKVTASNAIPLAQLDSNVAILIRERGTNQANVDLLTPQVVVTYLSGNPRPWNDEQLTKFWSWLSEWRHKDEMMNLLKVHHALRLVPTLKGLLPVRSPVFYDTDNIRLFEKLGLAFISSALSSSALQLLDHHGVLGGVSNLNGFLAAIDLESLPPLSDNEAELVFNHFATHYRSLPLNSLGKLKKLPVFPVLAPDVGTYEGELSNTPITWRGIDDLTIKGVSPMALVPTIEGVHFLDKASIRDPSCLLLKSLKIYVLNDEDVLSLTLNHFPSLSKSLQAAFISYIKIGNDRNRFPRRIKLTLGRSKFISTSDGTLQSPRDVIDPESPLKLLFPFASQGCRVPKCEDDRDREIFKDLRVLKLTKTNLSSDIIQERISYISLNSSSSQAMEIARSLIYLMNDRKFSCSDLSIDTSLRWLPTPAGLVSSYECIDSGRRDADLFDEVLAVLGEPKEVSPSFRALMNWDKLLPLQVITKQLDRVLGKPESEIRHRKVREIIRELASRQLGDVDISCLSEVVAERPWVPTKSGNLAPHSRAVFTSVPDSSCFYEIGFSKSDKQIYCFLLKMGCDERPTAAAIISELEALRDRGIDLVAVQLAVQLLGMLPDSITDLECASLLVPTRSGELVPLDAGVCYYRGSGIISERDWGIPIAHHFINGELAEKIKLRPLGLNEAEDDIDLGEKPITTIRNILSQYEAKQFFTEFIANASDAKAKRFSILVDDHKGPAKDLISEGLAEFQGPSLVVYNDGTFTRKDFSSILQTGIGGKRGEPDMIGHFGLGALSMFHFTELAMIVSGKYVLFVSPSKKYLSFCGRHSILLGLEKVKRLYSGHLEPLNGLFGFNMKFDGPYDGTLFRLPLRNVSHRNGDSVSAALWNVDTIQDMFNEQFDSSADKSLLFTGLSRIDVLRRQNSQVDTFRLIQSERVLHSRFIGDSFKLETVTFKTAGQNLPRWLIASATADIPKRYKTKLAEKYNIHHFLPVRIAAALDRTCSSNVKCNLFCSLPLPVTTSLPVHISAPLILEQERRNIRLDSDGDGIETKYNRWLLSSEVPRLYLYLLEMLLQVQGISTNIPWWPVGRHDPNVASKIFMDAFWSPRVLGESTRYVFASEYHTALSPKEAILFPEETYAGNRRTLSKIFSSVRPSNVAKISYEMYKCTRMENIRFVDATFVKSLLVGGDWTNKLTMDEIKNLMSFLSLEEVSLDGLPLLPLADGSYVKIQSQSPLIKTYYKFEPALAATTIPFKGDHFVHGDFSGYVYVLNKGYNISCLSEAEIVKLVEEYIKPAREFIGGEEYHTLVLAFWNAPLNIAPEKFSHLPLIPTLRQSHFISLDKVNGPSVIIVKDSQWQISYDGFDFGILQALGMTIVVRNQLPEKLVDIGRMKKHSMYRDFLDYMQENQARGLAEIQRLTSSDREKLGQWIRSEFNDTPTDKVDIACMLPIWLVGHELVPLNGVTILPPAMPSENLRPFTNAPVIDWQPSMIRVRKRGCNALRITQLLRVKREALQATDQTAYKRFLGSFLKFDKVDGYALLVPNERGILTPANKLFERGELFIAAFKGQLESLLLDGLGHLVNSLETYGLKRMRRLNLQMFVECAKAFDEDSDHDDKHARSVIMYRYFNNLPLVHQRDAFRCSELDKLRFIPRVDSPRLGYSDIVTRKYMAYLPDILSPDEIVLPLYEPICWSQRVLADPPPNSTLCGAYQGLGQPKGQEVIKHLEVLAQIGQNYGRPPALLEDLKATYKWLNDHASEIHVHISQRRSKSLFLNVDNPDSDEWEWHSASSLVMDLQDVGRLRGVKEFLRSYNDLLKAAGIRKIHNPVAKPVPIHDKTESIQRGFNEMRRQGCDVNVVFNPKEDENKILPAHRVWLIINSKYFQTSLLDAEDFMEARKLKSEGRVVINVDNYSSLCVKEVVGKHP
ncbi:hypothetical protein AX15_003527 [Amanita polypyramis BW_CC]|nr:hypothetical protein AX15_003527 [Amanita polypyramis BW_CC]